MDFPSPDSIIVKVEQGTTESDQTEMENTETDVKKECLERIQKIGHTADSTNIKIEPGTCGEHTIEMAYLEMEIYVPDFKIESLQHTERTDCTVEMQYSIEYDKPESNSSKNMERGSVLSTSPNLQLGLPSTSSKCSSSTDHRAKKYRLTQCKEKSFSFSEYDSPFSRKSVLNSDILTHSTCKPFSCSDCSSSFSTKSKFKRHMLTHSGIKSFSCSDCNASFSQNSDLRRHKLIHIGVKPFSCSDCSFTFSQNSDLQRHKLTHIGVKPFACSDCDRTFSRNSDLHRHKLTHSGIKPFSCSKCNYSCSEKSYLKKHLLTHSAVRPFSCSDCNISFRTKSHLNKHTLIHKRKKSIF